VAMGVLPIAGRLPARHHALRIVPLSAPRHATIPVVKVVLVGAQIRHGMVLMRGHYESKYA
jgi:hypothetical protein